MVIKMNQEKFQTLRGYNLHNKKEVSYAMEDYLEMICRLLQNGEFVRVKKLAALLNVTPPSASKMIVRLKEQGLINFEPYGIVTLTVSGAEMGSYLIYRHDVLNRFFSYLNGCDNQLELVEKIEHYIDRETLLNMEKFLSSRN